jgi:hypothetical protein
MTHYRTTPHRAFLALDCPTLKKNESRTAMQGLLKGYLQFPEAKGYFALEAAALVAATIKKQERENTLPPDVREVDGSHDGEANVGMPWIFVDALAGAWWRVEEEGIPIGRALGLEKTRGKRLQAGTLDRELDQRALAFFIVKAMHDGRAEGRQVRIVDAVAEVAERFALSDTSVLRAWKKHKARAKQTYKVLFGQEFQNS